MEKNFEGAVHDMPAPGTLEWYREESQKNWERWRSFLERLDYPNALIKATQDEFDYALCMNNGDVFRFRRAEPVSAEWVHLYGHGYDPGGFSGTPYAHIPDRGIEIRVSDILWVVDAPEGS